MIRGMKVIQSVGFAGLCALYGCTQPGETTAIGAATGGVLGAGLGAIVGNQTGNPGSGLAIGAVAGAGTGAMIANALETQQQTLRSQDEAIERQEQLIRAQKSELEELRRMNQNSDTSASTRPAAKRYSSLSAPAAKSSAGLTPVKSASATGTFASTAAIETKKKSMEETKRAQAPQAALSTERGSYDWNKSESASRHMEAKPATLTSTSGPSSSSSSECAQARSEAQRAKEVSESAEKLFHLRRALRMCPENADYHTQLGELYFTLNRKDDAEYEYNEALRLSPSNREARANLEYVKSK